MRKLLSVILAVLLVSILVTSCSPPPAQTAPVDNSTESPNPEPEATPESPAQPAGKGIPKEDVKVGVIHISDPSEGSGYTYAHDVGIVKMQQTLGLDDSQIIRKNKVDDTDPTAIESAIQECLEEGANIIFATSWGYMDTVEAMSEEYPEVYFLHGTGYKGNDTNFSNYFGRIYQARYLSGIVAGLTTKTDKIGFVAAMGVENSEVTGGINAFALGVESVNPDATIYVKVTNSWFSPEEETNAAKALLAEGCDVLGQHVDTANPQLEAEKAGVFGVGYNSDMSKEAPKATLTSVLWHWGVYYTTAVEEIIAGTWTPTPYFGGMKEGLVDISPLATDLVPEGTAAAVDEARAKILSGDFNVFDGPLETNDGTIIGEEGGTLDDATITGGINWYYKNVEVK